MGNKQCPFCRIEETNKNRIVYEDDQIIIFNDRSPVSVIHLQCIPRRHIKNINELTKNDVDLLNYMYIKARDFVINNYQQYLYQNKPIFGFHNPPFYTVPHLHMHCIIPPYTNCIMKVFNKCILKEFNNVFHEVSLRD